VKKSAADELKDYKTEELYEIKGLTDIYSRCIHCGMCLTSCPTYSLTGYERSSPRGRIKLIKSVVEGQLTISDTFAYEMNFCLDCQACETACPAGVKYGRMIEAARVAVEKTGYHSFIKSFFLNRIIPFKNRLKIIAKILRFYQQSGIRKFLRSIIRIEKLFPKLMNVEELSPVIPKQFSDSFIKEINHPSGKEKFRLAFSFGCLMNVFFPEVNKDTIELLNKIGAVVITPPGQTCCGSLNAHNGYFTKAKELAENNIKEFSKYDYDFLISNSAGCGAFMKEYGELFKDDERLAEQANLFSSKVKDLTEFLNEINLPLLNNGLTKEITYHDACHLVHTQKIYEQPRELFNKIKGLNLIPLEDSTKCCGSAGIYNILHYDDSMELLKQKINNIDKSNAEIVITGNPGCILQLNYGVKKFNKNVQIMHTATFLNKIIE
jgi:glycolate oxidase iron-sulfur subunit